MESKGLRMKGRRKTGRTARKKKNICLRIAAGILSTVIVLVLTAGLAAIIFYKSGEAALKASAASKKPTIEVDPQLVEKMRETYTDSDTVPWQEEWVVYEDGVYEYNESTLNFLIMGIDHKGTLDSHTDLSDWGAGQADTIFLVSMDQKNKSVSIIAIPRNAMVELDIYNEKEQCIDTIYNQICLQYGYAGGGELGLESMKACTSELFYGLPIHGACAVSFDAVSVITDMLGGIEVTIPDDMTGLNAGYVQGSSLRLTGKNVLPYLRYRETSVLGSPTTRLTRQKEFLKILISTAVAQVRRSPLLVSDMYQAVIPYMNTDISLDEAVYLATESLNYRIAEDSFYQLEGEDRQVDFVRAGGAQDFYDDLYLDEDAKRKLVMELFYEAVVWERN